MTKLTPLQEELFELMEIGGLFGVSEEDIRKDIAKMNAIDLRKCIKLEREYLCEIKGGL